MTWPPQPVHLAPRDLAAAIAAAVLARRGVARGAASRRGCSGAARAATSCRTRPASPRAGRRADRSASGRAPLGEGHSAILAEGGRIYTMYRAARRSGDGAARRSQEEVVAALDAATRARRAWEFTYPSPTGGLDFSQGAGPHATPLIAGNRVYATEHAQGALRARQGDRQARVVARFHQGIRRAVARARLRVQPDALQRHDHRDRRRPRPGASPRSTSRPARWCGRRATSTSSPASPIAHRRRRAAAARAASAATASPASIPRTAARSGATRTRPTGA